jgi:phosphatidylglycerol---prolipoprotein diacylglyceryl transferase
VHPVLARFDIAGTTLTLYAYSTFMVLAAVVALALAARGATRLGVPRQRALAWYGFAIAAGLVGARLLDVALNWGPYADDPGRIVALEFRGFALFGGLAAGLLVALALARAWRASVWTLADSAIPAVAAGIVLLRVGCFLNGCCAGTSTDLPWGISFPSRGLGLDVQLLEDTGLFGLSGASEPVHPTQLYEAGAALLCCALALLLRRRSVSPGTAALAFAAGFALFRAASQLLRPPAPTASVPEWLLPLGYLGVGAVFAAFLAVRWRASAATAASPGFATAAAPAD